MHPRALGRRRRRLYWTVGALAALAALGSVVGYSIYRSGRAETYRPGEALDEITSKLQLGIPERAPEPLFTDVTAAAGLDGFRAFAGGRTSQLPEDMGPGAAWGDYDGDGDDDLFLVSQGGPLGGSAERRARSRLYRNLGGGKFAEDERFPETRILGMGAAWGDYDGDGRLDLVVTGYGSLRLFHNRDGVLVRDRAIDDRPGFWSGASWSDFDRDGDLDLYVCGYVRYVEDDQGASRTTRQYGEAVPYTLNPASFEPARNLLFRNDGEGGFAEIAEELGAANPEGRGLGALWHDLDGDGWQDLYVANDISDNALLLNRRGRFEDTSHAAWVADYRGAMGLAAGDWNRDGDDDLFVTHWVAQENALYDSLRNDLEAGRPLRFMDVADQRGLGQIALQRIGWGTEFGDLDSDGWLDLVVANGSTFENGESPPGLRPEPPFLFWNNAGRSFHDLVPLHGELAEPRVGRGLALADYDIDGDLDLLIVERDGGVRLWRNEMPQQQRIGLRLVRTDRLPVEGSSVRLSLPDGVVRRTIDSVSYLSQSSRTLHLGLGRVERVAGLEIFWPDGSTRKIESLTAGALWEIDEGSPPIRLASWTSPAASSRERLAEFWRLQRSAMQAFKVDADCERAIALFGQALEIDPTHGDSLYYLGNCLAQTGDVDGALERFSQLMQADALSHRAHKRWGTLRAVTARGPEELNEAIAALEEAAAINPEETGVPLVLGEVYLMRGEPAEARRRLEWVVGSNPQSGEAYWVLAYLAWRADDPDEATRLLERARETRNEGWKPAGSVAEGETRTKMYSESTPFEALYESWDGRPALPSAIARLQEHLDRRE
jgi:tetratricopeptide (TPR) repeat protein